MSAPKTGSNDETPIRVVTVDDHDLLRQGVMAALTGHGIDVVGDAGNGPDGVDLARSLKPDVVLMDLVMPSGNGIDAIRTLAAECPNIKILALTSFGDVQLVREALAAGATSYVMKNVDSGALANAVRTTAAGQSALAPEVTRQLMVENSTKPQTFAGDLTDREAEVLDLLALGRSNAEIAAELNLSLFTVKNHVSSLLTKLDVKSRTEAAALVHRQQLSRALDPERRSQGFR